MIKILKRRFIAISMLAFFIVMFTLVLGINIVSTRNFTHVLDSSLQIITSNNGHFPKIGKKPPENWIQKSFGFPMTMETPFMTRYFVVYYDSNKNVINTSTEFIASITADDAVNYANKVINSQKDLGWYKDYRYSITQTDTGYMVVFLDSGLISYSINSIRFISSIIGLLSLVAVFILILLFSKKAIKPITDSYEKQKQFITDAGHELKTPLTIISANSEIMELNNEHNENLIEINEQTKKMNKLINQLIYLSRMEEEKPPIVNEIFNLSDAILDTASAFSTVADKVNKNLIVNIVPEIMYKGDEGLIRQLTSLLVDNAIKYCDNSGEITVDLLMKKHIYFKITNTYSKINEISLSQIFNRFYRFDKSRTYSGSYGLGLSIAKSIVLVHHGEIKVQNIDNDKIQFIVKL